MKIITTLALLTLGLLLCRPGDLLAQQEHVWFEPLTVEDGLSNGSVTSITQDQQGFMWFGTFDGLNKYDGYTFTIFRHDEQDPASVSSSYIECLFVDREGTLWVGTYGGGLNRFDPATETFTRYQHDPDNPRSLSDDYVAHLYEDREGALWLGTVFGGLNRFERETETFTHYRHDPDDPESLSDDNVRAIYEDSEGIIWIGTGGPWLSTTDQGGLNRFDRSMETFKRFLHDPDDSESLVDNRVWAIKEDAAGTLWVGTWGDGLYRYDRDRESFTRVTYEAHYPGELLHSYAHDSTRDLGGPLGAGVTFIHQASSEPGRLWLGLFPERIDLYDPASGVAVRYEYHPTHPFSPNINLLWTLYEDRQGILWIGGLGGGLNKVDLRSTRFPRFQQNVHNPDEPTQGEVSALYEDALGHLWIGRTGGLACFDRQVGTFTYFRHDPDQPNSLSSNQVLAILQDSDGVLWIGTAEGGLNRFTPGTNTFTHFRHDPHDPVSISSNTVSRIIEDRGGGLWIGTNAGLNRFDRSTNTFVRYLHDPGNPASLSNNEIGALLEGRDGTLWVSTERGGLNRYDPHTDTFTSYLREVENILTMYQDDSGILWLGSNNLGLHRFDPNTGGSIRYSGADGLPSTTIVGILGDDDGNLWISTVHGLTRFNPDTGAIRTFGVADGLQGLVFSFGGTHKSRSGELFFGGLNGFNAFYPDRIQADSLPPAVVLTGLRLARQSVRTGVAPLHHHISTMDAIELSHWQNDFTLEFAALHFSRPKENQYTYMLEGFDSSWNDVGTERSASYMNLPPGRYTFRVKASNYDGVWNEQGAALQVRILPPWWRTWWAYVLYALIFATGMFVADRVQRRRLIRTEREKSFLRERELRTEAAEAWANYLQAENLRQTQELEHARALQLAMLPEKLPEHPTVEIAAHMHTATEVGGDYYDFDLADDGTLTFAIGDATGHGVEAGTMVTAMKSLFNVFAREHDLERVMRASSQALRRMRLPKLYMALAIGKLYESRLVLIGAGMPPAIIYRAGSGCVEQVPLKGAPLGTGFDYPYEMHEVTLAPGDTLVLMSDGFPELRGETGEMLGYECAARVVEAVANKSPEKIIAHLMERAKTWRNGQVQDDDMTFVVMRVKGGGAMEAAYLSARRPDR